MDQVSGLKLPQRFSRGQELVLWLDASHLLQKSNVIASWKGIGRMKREVGGSCFDGWRRVGRKPGGWGGGIHFTHTPSFKQ
jgi:hypothetical protein